jgi:hypothetical protein
VGLTIETGFLGYLAHDRRLTIAEAVSPGTCLMRAKPQLANRVVRHGKWRAARWSCQIAGQGGTQI